MPSRNSVKVAKTLTAVGVFFILASVLIAALTFFPVAKVEIGYSLRKDKSMEIVPVDTDFGIVIPKIAANSKIIMNVDPFNSSIYQKALTQGVAHARGTGLPGSAGNVFLFSHSSVNFYEAAKYNSIFYLLTKLESGDEVQVYYHGKKYIYYVTSKTIVKPTDVQYLKSLEQNRQTLTLMTCWPPGTTFKRLLVIAERKVDEKK